MLHPLVVDAHRTGAPALFHSLVLHLHDAETVSSFLFSQVSLYVGEDNVIIKIVLYVAIALIAGLPPSTFLLVVAH